MPPRQEHRAQEMRQELEGPQAPRMLGVHRGTSARRSLYPGALLQARASLEPPHSLVKASSEAELVQPSSSFPTVSITLW